MKPSLIIVGLGNKGKEYDDTRHNAGFQAIDLLSEKFQEGPWKDTPKFAAEIQEGRIVTVPLLLVKPHTYMNRSGEAIRKLVDFYKLNPAQHVLVISDDIDIPLGELRFREKGGPGTHNGLKSIVEQFGEEFPRIRIGVGPVPTGADLSQWILSAFSKEENKQLKEVLKQLPAMVEKFVL